MIVRWLSRKEDGVPMRPVLALVTRRAWYGVRFGRERHMTFSERNQGARGIPIQWHRFFGGRLSFRRHRLTQNGRGNK